MAIRLREARERAVLSQADLARLMRRLAAEGTIDRPLTREAIARIELGLAEPHPGTLRRLAVALGVTPAWLARGEL